MWVRSRLAQRAASGTTTSGVSISATPPRSSQAAEDMHDVTMRFVLDDVTRQHTDSGDSVEQRGCSGCHRRSSPQMYGTPPTHATLEPGCGLQLSG
jgi:hypothetical protein